LFYQIGQADSALVVLTQAIDQMRKSDKDDLVFLYQSKALMEQRIGLIEHVKGHNKAAKDAFGRALEEDLSYFPAHVQLALMGLESGDSVSVTSEMDMAVQIKPDDAGIRYQYGFALGSLNRLKDAEVQLKKALELDPDFAAPHFILSEVYQASGRKPDALRRSRPSSRWRRKAIRDVMRPSRWLRFSADPDETAPILSYGSSTFHRAVARAVGWGAGTVD